MLSQSAGDKQMGIHERMVCRKVKIGQKTIKSKERKRSLIKNILPGLSSACRGRKPFSGRASLRTSLKKASIAVETAMVLPVFFLGMVTMISFMDIYKLQTEHLMKLCERTKEAGMYAYVIGGGGPENISLPDLYTYEPVGGLFPLPEIHMVNLVKVHAWTGREHDGTEGDGTAGQEEREHMVYVTETGSVYHTKMGCSYLDLSVRHVSGTSVSGLRNDYGEKYSACETCAKGQSPAGMVYITDTGNRYHNLETCSGLKRTVRMVKESHVRGEMHACSRCG